MQISAPANAAEPILTSEELNWFKAGSHSQLFKKMGAHRVQHAGMAGIQFSVWAPNAIQVWLIGDFNNWDKSATPLAPVADSGIWTGFVPGIEPATRYKFHLQGKGEYRVDKADPFAFLNEIPPQTASIVWELDYPWGDDAWMAMRAERFSLKSPVSIYEMHVGSWRRDPQNPDRWLNYREIAPDLADYVEELGFTHVELLPVMEHPFYGSWGYQITGYFAPSSRCGTPQDLMYLIDLLHQRGIGVILDWVPSHFPADEHGLAFFDGTHLFEHADPRRGVHPDWNSDIFDYGRPEVRSFLLSSAFFWLDQYHADGLRVDAVASMLYLDYSRKPGNWLPNRHGGRENLEAIDFLRQFNVAIYQHFPAVQTVAEESTAWPMVSRPTYVGGLGFGFKWDMGFMHDTLTYFREDPIFRKYHHNQLTFRGIYAFSENFILPFSHDEVVHGKGSLLTQMPGDEWQKLANLRLLFGYFYFQPGKKMLFMGDEFGQWREWNHATSLDWHLLREASHAGIQKWITDLNRLYRQDPALHQGDAAPGGFEWIDCRDWEQSTLSWLRRGETSHDLFLVIANFTPVVRRNYRIGVPYGGHWREELNSDAKLYGGSGQGNFGGADSVPFSSHGRSHTLLITLPPLALVSFKWDGEPGGSISTPPSKKGS